MNLRHFIRAASLFLAGVCLLVGLVLAGSQWADASYLPTVGSNLGIGTSTPVGALIVMSGNVGIGTWSPTQRLQVSGTVSATAFIGDGSGLTNVANSSGWIDGGTNVFTATTTDNVGIGTTTPTAALLVQNAGTQSSFQVNDAVLDSSPFIIDAGGNVGVGTTAPVRPFEIQAGVSNDALIRMINTDTAGVAGIEMFDSSGVYAGTFGYNNSGVANSYPGLMAFVTNTADLAFVTGDNYSSAGTTQMIIKNSGNVGIGTTTPVAGLAVLNGNVGIGTWSPTSKLQVVGTVAATAFVGDGSGLTGISANSGWTDGGSNVYTSTTTDNVGIGTNTPTAALLVENAGTQNSLRINDDVLDATPFIIDSAGNVGIGTSTPGFHFRVNDAGSDLVVGYFQTAGGFAEINVTNSTNAIKAGVDNSTGWYTVEGNIPLTLGTNSIERVRISNSGNMGVGTTTPVGGLIVMNGNVGVGTWSPVSKLQVIGTVNAMAFVGDGSGLTNVTGANSGWTDGGTNIYTSTTTDNVGIGTTNPTAALLVENAGAQDSFRVNDAVLDGSPFVISNSGSVGVGTTTPGSIVDVYGLGPTVKVRGGAASSAGFAADADTNKDAYVNFNISGVTKSDILYGGLNDILYINSIYTTPVSINSRGGSVGIGTTTPVGGTAIMNGNAGIGTWSPVTKLQVVDASSSSEIAVFTNQGGFSEITVGNSAGYTLMGHDANRGYLKTETGRPLAFETDANEHMRILTTGNIGIGTTNPVGGLVVMNGNAGIGTWSPVQKLEVIGTVKATAFVGDGSGLTGISANSGWTDGGTNVYTTATTDNVGIGTTTPTASLLVQNVTTVDSLRINDALADGTPFLVDSAGNVGIGTTTSGYKLQVEGEAYFNGTTYSMFSFYALGPNANNIGIKAFEGITTLYTRDGGGGGDVDLYLQPNQATAMILKSGSLNVGVGTINPMSKFVVNGGVGIGTLGSSTFINIPAPTGGLIVEKNVGIGTTAPVGALTVMNGNAGIGTWSPTQRLQVVGTVSATAFVGDGSGLTGVASNSGWTDGGTNVYTSTTTDNVGIGTTTPTAALLVQNAGAQDSFRINDAVLDGSPFLIDATGNVGIGTTTPLLPLEAGQTVAHQSFASETAPYMTIEHTFGDGYSGSVTAFHTAGDTVAPFHAAIYGNASGNLMYGLIIATSHNSAWNSSTGALQTGKYLGGIGLAGQTDGNNGTGTTMGASIIGQVDGTVSAGVLPTSLIFNTSETNSTGLTERMRINSAGNIGIGTEMTSATAKFAVLGGNVGIGTTKPVAGTAIMNGNVGIGTWSPTSRLQVIGTVNATSFVGDGSGLTGISVNSGWTDGGTNVYASTTTDNVGIGTTTPIAKLQVAQDNDYNPSDSTSANQFIIRGVTNPNEKMMLGIDTSDNFGYITAVETGVSGYPLMFNSSNVAIGNAINTNATLSMINDAAAGSSPSIVFDEGGGDTDFWMSRTDTDGNSGTDNDRFDMGKGTTPGNNFLMSVLGSGPVGIGTTTPVGGTSIMNGNVGIGTWSPTSRLQVIGTVNATAFVGDGSGLTNVTGTNSGWTDGGTNVYNTATTDNVGIGTTTPNAATLEVVKNTAQPVLKVSSTATGNGDFLVVNSIGNIGVGTIAPRSGLTVMNGNVGIGTTSAQAALAVGGTSQFQVDTTGAIAATTGIATSGGYTQSGTGANTLTGTTTFSNATTAAIFSSGNVGVGTTATSVALLNVNGEAYIAGPVGMGTFTPTGMLDVRQDEVRIWTGAGTDTNATAAGELYVEGDLEVDGTIYGDGSGITTLASTLPAGGWTDGGANVYTTTTTDNVGIGTTTPNAATLEIVKNAAQPLLKISSSATGAGNYLIVDSQGNVGLGTTAPNGALAVLNGNVGIGLVNPQSSLVVNGGNVGLGTVNAGSRLAVSGGVSIGSNQAFTTLAAPTDGLMVQGNVGIGTTAAPEKMVLPSGNVGIGTLNPVGGLVVMTGNVGVGTWSPVESLSTVGRFYLGDSSTPTDQTNKLYAVGGSLFWAGGQLNTGSTASGWTDVGAQVYQSTTTDFIGIGTTNPSTTLEIVQQGTNPALMVSSVENGDGNLLIVHSGGNVGIGTVQPIAKVVVENAAAIDSFRVNDATADSSPFVVDQNGNVGIGTMEVDASLEVIKSGSTDPFHITSSSAKNADYLIINSSGNVGIGTSTPVAALAVMNGNVGIGTWSPNGALMVASGNVGIATTSIAARLNLKESGDQPLIYGAVTDSITTNRPLINIEGGALDTATNVTLAQISTTTANDVDVTAVKIERGTNDAQIKYDEGLKRWQMDEGTGAGLLNVPLILDKAVTQNDVTGTSAETTIYSFSVPANTMTSTGILRLSLHGDMLNNTGGDQTVTLRIKFGGTTMYSDVNGSTNAMTSSANRRSWRVDVMIANQNSVSSQILQGWAGIGNAGGATTGIGNFGKDDDLTQDQLAGSSSVDTSSAARLLDITMQNSSNTTSQSTRRQFAVLELL